MRCRLCKEAGTVADIHPYCFPDAKDPVWLHRSKCSTEYHQKWREWREEKDKQPTSTGQKDVRPRTK